MQQRRPAGAQAGSQSLQRHRDVLSPPSPSQFAHHTNTHTHTCTHTHIVLLPPPPSIPPRRWWHKKYRCWFIHAPNSPVTKGPSGNSERGTYLFFDISIWDVVQKADVEVRNTHTHTHTHTHTPPLG